MHLRVLVVEDDEEIRGLLVDELIELGAIVDQAEDRDKALQLLQDNLYDLVSIDLTIPPRLGALDKDVRHGQAVLSGCRQHAPGTPVIVVTGSGAEAIVSLSLQDHSHQVDVWGDGYTRPTSALLEKADIQEYRNKIQPIADAFSALKDIEVKKNPGDLVLTGEQDRLLRVFTRMNRGVRCEVERLSGGLSGASVFKITVINNHGSIVLHAVAKIGGRDVIVDEAKRYRHVVALRHEAAPKSIATLDWGAKDQSAVFYQMVVDYKRSFFACALSGRLSPEIMRKVSSLTDVWVAGGHEQRVPVAQIRRRLIADDKAARVIMDNGITWAGAFEARSVSTNAAFIHGDLHGGNVLVNEEEQAACLIDYGDVEQGFAAIDPVTLEFSFLFHPDSRAKLNGWPTNQQARSWWSPDVYLQDCPIPGVVQGCRNWAKLVCVGERDMAAAVYAYALRQLKYPETDKALAIALIEGAKEFFDR